MGNLLDRVRGWWQPGAPAAKPVPFQVACRCGHVLVGERQRRHQILPCPACKKKVFILPLSPLPAPRAPSSSRWLVAGHHLPARPAAQVSGPAMRGGWLFWRWPLLAAGVTLLAVTAGVVALLNFAVPPSTATTQGEIIDPQQWIREGEQALADGQFQTAGQKFQQGLAARAIPLPLQEVRRVRLLARQADLLGDLLTEPLADIVQLAMVDEKQWPEQFARRYRGRGVVFDAEVRRDAAAQYRLNYHVQAGGQAVRIELGDLRMLELLPLQKPARLLFGARLASVAREAGGFWTIRFEPDSGVLLTDERAVAASCPPPLDDELHQVLERQAAWAAELP